MVFMVRSAALGALVVFAVISNAAAFDFRFYDNNSNCNHDSAPGDTWPPNNDAPEYGVIGSCYSAPTYTNFNNLEIDDTFSGNTGVVTYCNIGCAGGESGFQRDTYCYAPVSGCAIGSFMVFQ